MKITKRKIVVTLCIIATLAVATITTILIHNHIIQQREENAIMEEERMIRGIFLREQYAFGLSIDPDNITESDYHWYGNVPPPSTTHERNRFGLNVYFYLFLYLYERETGIVLPHDTVVEFRQHRLEPDGSLRLYNNGRHPEVQKYVEWVWEGRHGQKLTDFAESIEDMYRDYFFDNRDEGFEIQPFFELSPKMLDALIRAHFDSDYVLDLTSIQQAGY